MDPFLTLIAIVGLSALEMVNQDHSQQIAAVEKKINELRSKNDKKSQHTLNKIDRLMASNHELSRMFPRYGKHLAKDTKILEAKRAREVKRYSDANAALNDVSVVNQDRANDWTGKKLATIAKSTFKKDYRDPNYNKLDEVNKNFNLDNFEQEV